MIISDLDVLETVQEENIQGAGGSKHKKLIVIIKKPVVKPPSAEAKASADATALGKNTFTSTTTSTTAVAGVGSSSSSTSHAKAS